MRVDRFEDLRVWQLARHVCLELYRVSGTGAFERDFGLKDQVRRASVSVMSNLAEGFERYSHAEFLRFLSIARGSAAELRCQLHVAHGLGYLTTPQFDALSAQCLRISRMIARLRATTRGPRRAEH